MKSDLCYMKGAENAICNFDHGGYFLINGAEKTCKNKLVRSEEAHVSCYNRLLLQESYCNIL